MDCYAKGPQPNKALDILLQNEANKVFASSRIHMLGSSASFACVVAH